VLAFSRTSRRSISRGGKDAWSEASASSTSGGAPDTSNPSDAAWFKREIFRLKLNGLVLTAFIRVPQDAGTRDHGPFVPLNPSIATSYMDFVDGRVDKRVIPSFDAPKVDTETRDETAVAVSPALREPTRKLTEEFP
jgi:hypothetical protein